MGSISGVYSWVHWLRKGFLILHPVHGLLHGRSGKSIDIAAIAQGWIADYKEPCQERHWALARLLVILQVIGERREWLKKMPIAFRMQLKIFRQRLGRMSGQFRDRIADFSQIPRCNLQEVGYKNLHFIVIQAVSG
jgi:hypothetical protein